MEKLMCVAADTEREITIWDADALTVLRKVSAPNRILKIRSTPAGDFFMIACEDTWVYAVNAKSKFKALTSFNGLTAMAISDDWKNMALGNASGTIALCRLPTRGEIFTLRPMETMGSINCLTFENGSQCLLSGGTDQLIYRWDVSTCGMLQGFEGHQSEVRCCIQMGALAISGAGYGDGSVKMWRLDSGAEILSTPESEDCITAVALSQPNGTLYVGTEDGSIYSWNLENGYQLALTKFNSLPVTEMALADDDSALFVSFERENTIYLLNPERLEITGRLIHPVPIATFHLFRHYPKFTLPRSTAWTKFGTRFGQK